ncbi:carbohydrate kinase family protein [Haladaptatus sp. DYSN1]|uniref:carbohydrate kinase family protein n=1 Tax=unclassified Haladaptatus TaxID=2622732 RepID=UPI00240762B8|nr:carbohydrate kinase family protein [Haladaptatus sp. DYSN1]
MPRVICAGHVNWDLTLRVDRLPEPDGEALIESQLRAGGGSAANTAVALTGLGTDVGLIGSVGTDENGRDAREELTNAGLDLSHLLTVAGETAVKYLIVDPTGEVMVLGNKGANEAVTPDDVDPEYVRSADHIHLTSQRPDTAAHIAQLAAEAGIPVSFDPGRRVVDRDFSATLPHVDYLLLNRYEAEQAEDKFDLDTPDRVVVTKFGAGGAQLITDGKLASHAGFDVETTDSTGAGDAFAAGFIHAQLAGKLLPASLEFAAACGALASQQSGARTSLSPARVRAFLADHEA